MNAGRFIINEYRRFAEHLLSRRYLEPQDTKREAMGAELLAARLIRAAMPCPLLQDNPEADRLCHELKDITESFCNKVDGKPSSIAETWAGAMHALVPQRET